MFLFLSWYFKLVAFVCELSIHCFFRSLIEQYFGGRFDVEYKCVEAAEETPTRSEEDFLQLSCFISQDVRYMLSGLRSVRLVFSASALKTKTHMQI